MYLCFLCSKKQFLLNEKTLGEHYIYIKNSKNKCKKVLRGKFHFWRGEKILFLERPRPSDRVRS
jgi:hypothetical protein